MTRNWKGQPRPKPWHRSDSSWGTLCGLSDTGLIQITDSNHLVTCKRCQGRMQALLKKYGPSIAR